MKRRLTDVWWSVIPWILQMIVWIPTQGILRFFFHFRVEGYEHIKTVHGPVIFVSNHTSYWDPIMIPAALPLFSRFFPMMYVARERHYYQRAKRFIGSTSFKVWGAHPAHGGLRDYARVLKDHERFLLQNRSLCVFPEGTLPKKERIVQPFKGGIGYLVYHTKATIVPISITGMFYVKARDFWGRKRYATLTFGKPIFHESFGEIEEGGEPTIDKYKSIASIIHRKVEHLFKSKYNNYYD